MNYRDIVFFCTSILALKTNDLLKEPIKKTILKGVKWELFVKISTSHYILPALYIRLREAQLLYLLPDDLVAYMKDITTLNKTRNRALYAQVLSVNALLKSNDITPIFLKGTAHICVHLYDDIAERMIGDIDLIVAPNKMLKAAKILQKAGYHPLTEYHPQRFEKMKHYPRLVHKKQIGAVEIHKAVVNNQAFAQLNYEKIEHTKQNINGVFIPSFNNMIIHNAINTQINDSHFLFSKINLRQQFDLFLLSKHQNVQQSFKDFKFHFNITTGYLVKTSLLFHNDPSLSYQETIRTRWVLHRVNSQLKHPIIFKFINAFIFIAYNSVSYFFLFIYRLKNKIERQILVKKVTNRKWLVRFFQLNYKALKAS